MRSNRRKKSIWAIPALAVFSVSSFAGAAAAQTIIEQGSSDDLVAPPSPNCPADAMTIIPEVEFTSAGSPIDAPVLGVGSGLVASIDVEDFDPVGPGTVDIVEIITYDAHTGRALWPEQDNESVAIEFLLDGEVVAMSAFTPDVEDGVNSAWVVSSLGELELPDGADAARVVHFNQELNNDSVVVASACAMFTAAEVDTEVEGSTQEADEEEPEEELTLDERIERNSATESEAAALAAAAEAAAEAALEAAAEAELEAEAAAEAAAEAEAEEEAAAEAEAEAAAEAAAAAEAEAEAAAEATAEAEAEAEAAAAEGADGDELAATGANEIAFAIIALGIMIFGIAFKIQSTDLKALRPEQF